MTSEQVQGGTPPRDEQSMATLLQEETTPYPRLHRGVIIEGVVVGANRDGILVDIGAKSEGVIPPHEMHCLRPEGPSRLRPGEKVLVFVVQPESPEGQIILSLDRARGEHGWRVLQEYVEQNASFEGHVTGSNKGGLLVNVEGVNAFVPLSQIVSGPDRNAADGPERALSGWVGKTLHLKVIELNRRRNRAILSERAAVQERRASEKERLLQEIQEGDIRTGRITSIRDFGVFVDIGGADGLVHLSELSWERTPKSPHELFKAGDEVEVYVLKVDQENKRIALSVRRAQPQRWEEMVSPYREGQIVVGQVTKLAPFGAFVRLEGPIEGLIHISELVERRVNHPKDVVAEGDVVPVKIVRIEHDRHRLGLSLRQARDKAEEDGWAFSDSGGVVSPAPGVLDQLGIEAHVAAAEAPAELEAEIEAVSETEAVAPQAMTEIEAEADLEAEPAPAAPAVMAPEAEPQDGSPIEATEEVAATPLEMPIETEPEAEVTASPEALEATTDTPSQEAEEPDVTKERSEALNREGETPTDSESAPVEAILSNQTQAEREGGS